MNWGKGLMMAMIAFMAFIVTLVVSLVSHDVQLDTEDYYQLDLAYDGEMEAMNRANGLEEQIALTKEENGYVVEIPSNQFITDVSVFFNRPNDKTQDFVIEVGDKRMEKIPLDKLHPGVYNIEYRYFSKGKACLQKDRIYV
ncbi:MAG: FixH family protein [Flavobacteriales bacterium]|nr:FixH family protein [Flavobacteriales bacterium]